MNEVILSISIPIYNVENYVERCIKSIIDQLDSKIEVLLIDDGSPDKSIEIIKKYINDENVRLISKKNGGVSSARNLGI